MSNDEKMSIDERRKYLRLVKPRYSKAGRKEKGWLLDEMQAVTGLDRKTLVRLMNGRLERQPRRKERGKTYGPAVDDALAVIYERFDGLCAARLTPNLVWMAKHLAQHDELVAVPELLEQPDRISVSTVERRLVRLRPEQPRRPRPKPRGGNKLLQKIPCCVCLGPSKNQVTSRPIWFTTVVLPLPVSMPAPCRWSARRPAGVSGGPCWGAVTW